MIKEKLKRGTFLYKIYLYYHLFFRYKLFYKKKNYSQFNEDLFIDNFFKNIQFGKFLDIGCFHPIRYNNTYLLYKKGWRGTNIDLNPTSIDMFNIVRNQDTNICAAISETKKKMKIFFENSFSAANTLSEKIYNEDQKKNKLFKHVIEIQTKTLKELLKNKFDFLNIDVEGLDFDILKTIDLELYRPNLICIEILERDNKKKDKIFFYLKRFNYSFCKKGEVSYFFKLDSFNGYNI